MTYNLYYGTKWLASSCNRDWIVNEAIPFHSHFGTIPTKFHIVEEISKGVA